MVFDYRNQKELHDEELKKRKQAIQDIFDGNLPKMETQVSDVERKISLTQTKSLVRPG